MDLTIPGLPATYAPFFSVAFIVALVGLLKGRVEDDVLPIAAILIGVVDGLLIWTRVGGDWLLFAFAGIGLGLTAMGMYGTSVAVYEQGRKRKARKQAKAVAEGAPLVTTSRTEPAT